MDFFTNEIVENPECSFSETIGFGTLIFNYSFQLAYYDSEKKEDLRSFVISEEEKIEKNSEKKIALDSEDYLKRWDIPFYWIGDANPEDIPLPVEDPNEGWKLLLNPSSSKWVDKGQFYPPYVPEETFPLYQDWKWNRKEPRAKKIKQEELPEQKNFKTKKRLKKEKKKLLNLHSELEPLYKKLNKKVKNKNWFKVFPEEFKPYFDQLVILDRLESEFNLKKKNKKKKKIKKTKLDVPRVIKSHFPFVKTKGVSLKEMINLLKAYNFIFNSYWVNYAYKIHCSFGSIKRRFDYIKEKKFLYKKVCTEPFEFLINEQEVLYGQLKKKKNRDNIKIKKKMYNSGLDSIGISLASFLEIKGAKRLSSLLFSHYMGKKNIILDTTQVDELCKNHKDLMLRENRISSDDLNEIRLETLKLFEGYEYTVDDLLVLPNKSYYMDGDLLLHDEYISKITRQDYQHFFHTDGLRGGIKVLYNDFMKRPVHEHAVKLVPDKGKVRVITTNHPATCLMKNLQKSVHSFLRKISTFKYIGAQVADHVNLIVRGDDRILSGDYENSTDFIPQEVTRVIWEAILSKIDGHPNLKRLVFKSLDREELVYPDGTRIMKRSGQLMGSLTSFPALCILNHIVTKKSKITIKKINGDDVLAMCTQREKELWEEQSVYYGLKVNSVKSHLNKHLGTFNSQLIIREGSRLNKLPHFQVSKLRSASLNDLLNLGLYNRKNCVFEKDFSEAWFQHHDYMDLFNGDLFTPSVLDIIGEKYPFFKYFYNDFIANDMFMVGKVGGMSLGYDQDDYEKMVEYNWNNRFCDLQDIVVGDGVVSSLKIAYESGDFDFIDRWRVSKKKYLGDDEIFSLFGENGI